jgi:hypothetical protein
MLLVEETEAAAAPPKTVFNDNFMLESGITPPTLRIAKRKWRRRKIIAVRTSIAVGLRVHMNNIL